MPSLTLEKQCNTADQGKASFDLKRCPGALVLVLSLCLLLPTGLGLAAGGFAASPLDSLRPYQQSQLTVYLPFDGALGVYYQVDGQTFRLYGPAELQAGEQHLELLGLSALNEPLPKGQGELLIQLEADNSRLELRQAVQVLSPAAGLVFATLSKDSLPAIGGEDIYIDHQMAKAGYLDIALYQGPYLPEQEAKPLRKWSLERQDLLPHAFRFDKKLGGKPLLPGHYSFVLKARGSAQEALVFPFELTQEPVDLALGITGQGAYLPSDLDDASVWAALMAPAAVLDAGQLTHISIKEAPDKASRTLGLTHGQTVGLQVLQTDVKGYARVRLARQGDGAWMEGYVLQSRLRMVQPAPHYGLLLDKGSQTLHLYHQGHRISSLKISTGLYQPPGDRHLETCPGSFLTGDRLASFTGQGFRYNYALRLDGGNFMHELGHRLVKGQMDYSEHLQTLGQLASHGCVRIQKEESQEGFNAFWLYANLPRNTKVIVLPENYANNKAAPWAADGITDDATGTDPGEAQDLPETPADMAYPSEYLVDDES